MMNGTNTVSISGSTFPVHGSRVPSFTQSPSRRPRIHTFTWKPLRCQIERCLVSASVPGLHLHESDGNHGAEKIAEKYLVSEPTSFMCLMV